MLNLNPNYYWQVIAIIFILFVGNINGQNCAIIINDVKQPTSCYAKDGSISFTATDQPANPCLRSVKLLQNNVQIAQGTGNLTVPNLGAGKYTIIALNGCGCTQVQNKEIILSGGEPTQLTPFVDKGTGFYQAKKVYACRGSILKLGVQTLGTSGLTITGPGGYSNNSPTGSSFFTINNLQPSQSGLYTIQYINVAGCISSTTIEVEVGTLNVNAGDDQTACKGSSFDLSAVGSGQAICKSTCSENTDSLLVNWTLDACNADGAANQYNYSEFVPTFPSNGNCTDVDASNIYRDNGDHSCTPVIGSYAGDGGMCIPSMESCDPSDYDASLAVKFSVTITPEQIGRLTKLTFREQSPLNWVTSNGSTGVNNYNTKYLIRVYKNDILIYEEDERLTERSWNLETFDFTTIEEFNVSEISVFRFELRGYCVVSRDGVMNGWELDDIRVFGGCCDVSTIENPITYLWSTGSTNPNIQVNPLSSSIYTVTVSDCKGCIYSDQVNITVRPLPDANIIGESEICIGGKAVLTASGGSKYSWSTNETTQSITVMPSTTTNYTVTVTSADNCSSTTSHSIVVNELPSPVISGDLEICLGESTTLTASGATSYIWSTGATSTSITISPTSTTNISVKATDSNGCENETTVQVVVRPLPNTSISGDLEICLGESTTLTSSGGVTYIWSTGETSSSITVSPSINTQYTVTATNEYGCTSSNSIEIKVHPLPIIVISGNSEFCVGTSSVLTASGGVSYVWSTGQTSPSIMINPGMETTYTVTATDGNGCSSTASRMASVMHLPEASITGKTEICLGEQVELAGDGGINYHWSTGGNTNTIQVAPSVTTFYYLTVTDSNGCTGTSVHSIIVNPNPTVNISGVTEFCVGESTKLMANVSGNTFCKDDCVKELLVSWNLDDCNAEGTANQLSYTEFTPEIINSGNLEDISATIIKRNRGDHSCTPDGTGGAGLCVGNLVSCDPNEYERENAIRFSVTVNPNEVGKLTKLTFREQSPYNWVTLNGATGINNINQKYLIRVYKNGNLIYAKNDLLTERTWNLETFDFSTHPEFRIEETSTFEFELYGYCVEDRGGMTGWELDDVRVFGGECPSSPVLNNITYTWSTSETSNMIMVNPANTTTYSITVVDCNGCSATDDATVIVNPLPNGSISGDTEICVGESTTLTASGGSSYAWSTSQTGGSITVSPSSTTSYTVTVTSDKGCESTTSVTVIVNPLPNGSISGDTEICVGEGTTLTASGGSSYAWSTGDSGCNHHSESKCYNKLYSDSDRRQAVASTLASQ
ncbi:MAG: hypothetical protein R2774_09075 [Saprospiraceae bacterium]